MPHRAWRTARDLAAGLAFLALVQLVVSVAVVGSLSPAMLFAQVALVVALAGLAFMAHRRMQAHLGYGSVRRT